MSESGFHRPRRALAHDTDSDEPTAVDDTPGGSEGSARRGVDAHSQAQDPTTTEPVGDGGPDASPESANPFARPGSESASTTPVPPTEPLVPAPIPVLPGPDFEDVDPTVAGRRMSGLAHGPTPAPRRSAASSVTPPEREPLAAPAAPAGSGGSGGSGSWVQHHKRTLLIWIIGALVAALLLVFGFYVAGQRNATPPPPPSPSPSPSTSVSAVPDVTGEDLLTVADADKIVGGASWAVISTALTAAEATERPACLSTEISDVNAVETFQRSLGTSQDDGLAALHQIDVYANEGAARQVQLERSQSLAACDEVSALIEASTVVTGLADEVTQLTVSRQDDPNPGSSPSMHTVLLVRTGRTLTMLDVTRRGEAVSAIAAVSGVVPSLDSFCDRVDGMCPSDPAATAAVPPVVDPQGWLITADLPRVRPGYGAWKATDPKDVTSKGMGCENLPLATEPGPTSRQQRTYLMTQDDKTPKEFGIDEIVFDFADNPSARAFTTKLISNLLSCKDRGSLTAKVADLGAVNGVGAEGVGVSARMITIDQAISDDSSVQFQLVVAIADTRVSYMLATVAPTYEFSPSQLSFLALRTAQRNSQG